MVSKDATVQIAMDGILFAAEPGQSHIVDDDRECKGTCTLETEVLATAHLN